MPAQCVEPITTTSPRPRGDQLDAAQDERPHQDLAQLGVGLHQREQLLAIDLDHLARLADAHRASARRPVIMLPSPENCPARCVTISVSAPAAGVTWISPLDDHEERDGLVADLDQHLAARDGAAAAMRRNPRHLRRRSTSETAARHGATESVAAADADGTKMMA